MPGFAGWVFDRGRLLQLSWSSPNFNLDILASCMLVFKVSNLKVVYSENSVYGLSVAHGYCSKVLGEYSIVLVFGNNGDSQVVYKFFEEMLQQDILLWQVRNVSFPTQMEKVHRGFIAGISKSIRSLQNCTSMNIYWLLRMVAGSGTMSTAEVFENTRELIDQMFGNCKNNFSCNKGNFNLQLRCWLLIRGMLILVTAQQLLPCDCQMLARWLRDKMHYSRVELYEWGMGFQKRLIKVNGVVHSVLLLHLKIELKVFAYAVPRSLATMGGIGSISFCSTTIGVRSEIRLQGSINREWESSLSLFMLLSPKEFEWRVCTAELDVLKMETPSPVGVMLLVWKLIILREYNFLFFSSQFGFTVLILSRIMGYGNWQWLCTTSC